MPSSVETMHKGKKYTINYTLSSQEGQIGNCGMRLISRVSIAPNFSIYDSNGTLVYPKTPAPVNTGFIRFGGPTNPTYSKEEKELANCIISSARDKISKLTFDHIFGPYAAWKSPQNIQFIITDGINGDRSTGNYVEYSNGYRTCDFMGWLLEGNAKDFVTVHPGPITWNYNHSTPDLPSLVQCLFITMNNAEIFTLNKDGNVNFTEQQRSYIETEYRKKYSTMLKYQGNYWEGWSEKFFTRLYHSGKED